MDAISLIRKAEKLHTGINCTRFYNVVVPYKSGECRIDTYAVKTRSKKTGELAIKKVARYRSDKRRYWVRDIIYNTVMHTYSINWCNESFGRKHTGWYNVDYYIGKWGHEEYSFNHIINLRGRYLNDFTGTKYEHCGFNTKYMFGLHFLQYAECWNISHSTEFMAKAGLWRFIRPSFIHRLTEDIGLQRYFRSSIKEIKHSNGYSYGTGAVLRAYKHGETLAEASAYLSFLGELSRYKIPRCIARKQLFKYFEKYRITPWQYERYCWYLDYNDIDINTYGYMFPSDFMKKLDEVEEAYHAKQRRLEKARKAKERREDKARLEHWERICGYIDKEIVSKLYSGFAVFMLQDKKDLIAEGNVLHNCIGGYGESVKTGRALLLSIRKDGKPCADIEIEPKSFKVMQVRANHNRAAPQEIQDLAQTIADEIKTGVEASRRKVV